MKNIIRQLVWDWDGVLRDCKNLHYETLNQALREVDSKYEINTSDHLGKYDGLPTKKKLEMLTLEKGLDPKLYQQIWDSKQQKTIEFIKAKFTPDERIISVLKSLKEKGYKLYIASNSIRETLKLMILYSGYMEYIEDFISNEDVKNPKPHPEMYLKSFIHAGVSPKECLIIEDSPSGLQAAHDSGAHVLRVKDPSEVTLENILNRINEIENNVSTKVWNGSKNFTVLIPMAGAGSRFAQAGYTFPKPLIEVNNKPMIQVVTDNLAIKANYVYVVQKEHYEKYNLSYVLNLITPGCKIVQTEGVTEGAACTTLLAKEYINNDNHLIIANSDQFMEWDSNRFYYSVENDNVDGHILTFESTHPKWSFIKENEEGYITEVAEKKPISKQATTGVYAWSKGSDYVKYAEQMIKNNIRVNNEFYVAPVYNEAIAAGLKFKKYNIERMWGIGTPSDLTLFLEKHS